MNNNNLDLSHLENRDLISKILNKKLKSKTIEIHNLFSHTKQDLLKLGINEQESLALLSAIELARRYLQEKNEPLIRVHNSFEVYNYIQPQYLNLEKEEFRLLLLNNQNQIIDNSFKVKGAIAGTQIFLREIIEYSIKKLASSMILIHNHPSGNSNPSLGDKNFTKKITLAGKIMNILVFDHIIIGEGEYYSFKDAGFIDEYEEIYLDLFS